MKRNKMIVMGLATLAVLFAGCGSEGTTDRLQSGSGVEDVLAQKMEESESANAGSTEESLSSDAEAVVNEDESEALGGSDTNQESDDGSSPVLAPELTEDAGPALKKAEGVDVDLTILSSTMVYSEVFNIMTKPDDYVGKVFKMRGLYSAFYDEAKDKRYFACIIQDATACCAQGIEFELTEDYSFPEDYPEDGDMITVTGVFDTYEEDGGIYGTLRNATME